MPFYQYILTIREEIACLFILVYIAWTYFIVKRKNTYAHNLFTALNIVSIINLAMDAITIYTVNDLERVPGWLNHLLHVIYIGTFPVILYITYSYIKCLTFHIETHRFKSTELLPLVIAVIGIAVLPMHYVVTPYSNYSSGPADNVAYVCAFLYFLLSVWLLFRYGKQMDKKAFRGISMSLGSLVTVVILQGLIEQLLITGIAVTLINVALYYTVESPDSVLIEKLNYERERADAANKAKSSFLARMSHEIRTPINAIAGMDEMILRETKEENTLAYAEDIRTTVGSLLSLINEILDFSTVEVGKMEIVPVQYEVSVLLNDLTNKVREKTERKNIAFLTEIDRDIPGLLFGDAIRIKQCINTLLANAVKYTDLGKITLRIGFEKAGKDEVILSVSVEDTGTGIKETDLSLYTTPLSELDADSFSVIEDTGLDMHITRRLLALMESELDVKSEYGRGSVFSFRLRQRVVSWVPIGDDWDPSKKRVLGQYTELFHAPDARILAIDDTEMNLAVILKLLKKTMLRIDTADSGQEALMKAASHHYDICLVDHMMPEMDGIETMRELRELSGTRNSVFIALTANAVSGAREFYLKEGFDDYLAKPVNGEQLERLLLQYLPQELVMPVTEEAGEPVVLKESGLPEIEGLDQQAGLTYCGSESAYRDVLEMFYQTLPQRAEEIEQFYRTEDIPGYRIKVHALKSSAKIIGAFELSEDAARLEKAADDNDLSLIREKTEELLLLYRSYQKKLAGLFENEEDKAELPPVDEVTLKEAYRSILDYADSMDYELLEGVLTALSDYRLPAHDAEKLSTLKNLLFDLNWDGITELCKEEAV
ncbi:MAG: response regulator [Lachnospiraceae bacterium]|nr:response regulator [Lachnospiraceae bacterium]